MSPSVLALIFVFILVGRWLIRHPGIPGRDVWFGLLNLTVIYRLFFQPAGFAAEIIFLIYVGGTGLHYLTVRGFARKPGWTPWLAFFIPILALVLVRYTPPTFYAGLKLPYPIASYFVGISYLAFRSSLLVLQVRNGQATMPSLARYLSFCFFVPTMQIGPISPYTEFNRAFAGQPLSIPLAQAGLRMLVGAAKYQFLAPICNQLSYSMLLQDDYYHPWMDLPVAMAGYYLFLYCNFSGFCDMAIGAAGLMGIPVAENFNNPLAARNMREFWNRWHITLSQYMRDVVFAPLSKFLIRVAGPANANHAVALTIAVVFLLMGIWHGVGWNYALFGAAQSLGVVTVHYYTLFLKKRLGRERFKAYNENRWIHAVAVVITFCYYAATLFLFANTVPQMKDIFSSLR